MNGYGMKLNVVSGDFMVGYLMNILLPLGSQRRSWSSSTPSSKTDSQGVVIARMFKFRLKSA